MASDACENVTEFKYLGTVAEKQNCKQEEVEGGVLSVSGCHRSVCSAVSPCPLYRGVKVEM
jgi:hypothetical protein